MDGGSLEYVESVAGPGAGGLTIFRTLAGAYSTLGKEGIKGYNSGQEIIADRIVRMFIIKSSSLTTICTPSFNSYF